MYSVEVSEIMIPYFSAKSTILVFNKPKISYVNLIKNHQYCNINVKNHQYNLKYILWLLPVVKYL